MHTMKEIRKNMTPIVGGTDNVNVEQGVWFVSLASVQKFKGWLFEIKEKYLNKWIMCFLLKNGIMYFEKILLNSL